MRGTLPALILLLVFIAGYAVQRGSICAVGAVHDLVDARRADRILAFPLCGALALAVMAAAALIGIGRIDAYRGASALLPPAVGGALFGAGAWINGTCAFGTIAKLGAGDLARIGTLAGMFVGFALAAWLGAHEPAADLASPLAAAHPGVILIAALAVGSAIIIALRSRLRLRSGESGWPPLLAMTLIGLVNGVLLVLAAGWPYTNLLMALAGSGGMELTWRTLMAAIFLAGAFAAALAVRGFRPTLGSVADWTRFSAGGALMGLGAILVPGGNDTMLLVGLPLLLPNLVIAYVAMTVAILALVVRQRPGSQPVAA